MNKEHSFHSIRRPAVAGQFYTANAAALRAEVEGYIAAADAPEGEAPKAVISPHAGYMYSGPIAGSAYAWMKLKSEEVKRVVLMGPAHYVACPGVALSSADGFATPLGVAPVDTEAASMLEQKGLAFVNDAAHAREHSLEVQLPFIQTVFPQASVVPLVVGHADAAEVYAVLEELRGGTETRFVISSDMSHFLSYDDAVRMDAKTSKCITSLDWQHFPDEGACGSRPVSGMLMAASKWHLQCRLVDLRNSGDTAGGCNRVVGYGAFVFAAH